ncbi:MAG: hypothetical protein ACR2QC_09850 [Gammaproteobacteria bacterium]
MRASANGGFALRRMRFRLSPEWCIFIFSDTAKFGIVRKNKKNPPFRRKPESLFHSGESRNLRRRKAAGNCTPLQFAPSAWRFLPSQEWDGGRKWDGLLFSHRRKKPRRKTKNKFGGRRIFLISAAMD